MLTRLAATAPVGTAPVTPKQRLVALLLTTMLLAVAVLVWPATPAHAACTDEEWANAKDAASIANCVKQLSPANGSTVCAEPPAPGTPDSGMAGWFVTRQPDRVGATGLYSDYGYAGYSFIRYDVGCSPSMANPGSEMATTIANGEMMIATSIVGASNAFRERAWNPATMWGWADPLVDKATKAVYNKVFRVFGAITLVVVGLYLIWRSRQSDMSDAMTTAGWAVFVMVVVTALFAYPVWASKLADNTLIQSLGVVHDAIGPRAKDIPPDRCRFAQPGPDYNPDACKDNRPPAVRASDTATDGALYRNWLRGILGSSTSKTAEKYGLALYNAKSLSWDEVERIRANPSDTKVRQEIISDKNNQWRQLAAQIQREDPEAYEYLAGKKGMEQVGAGAIAMIAAFFFSLFDIAASVLIILGFLIFRWAVVAAPIVGTIALLRPASGGLKRIGNAVVAAIFNIIVFGAGAAIYLFAVDLIMTTPSLAGWLQVLLIALCGVVGWMLLRPYRRLTQLGGKDSMAEVTAIGSWHRRFFGDLKQVGLTAAGTYLGDVEALDEHEKKKQAQQRTETRRRIRPESEPDRIPDPQGQPITVSRPPGDDVRDEPADGGVPQQPPAGDRRHETEHARMFGDGQTVYVDDDGVLYAEPETINGQQVYVVHRDHAHH